MMMTLAMRMMKMTTLLGMMMMLMVLLILMLVSLRLTTYDLRPTTCYYSGGD